MSDNPGTGAESGAKPRRSAALLTFIVLLSLEALTLAGVMVYLVIEIIQAPVASVASASALALVAAIATIWVVFMVVGVLRGNAWVRAGSVVLQILFLAVAVGSVQGSTPLPALAIGIAVPAIAALVLCFTKPVVEATSRRDRDVTH